MKKDDSGQAFPFNDGTRGWSGLTKREWFAGMALQGMVAYCGINELGGHLEADTNIGRKAFIIADAMIKAGGEE